MRLLVLARYEDMGASSRYRILQYLPALKESNLQVDVHSLLDNGYLVSLYGEEAPSIPSVAAAYIKRLKAIMSSSHYDVVWIEKEAMPFLPGRIERFLIGRGTPYVLDYDDAVFHRYDAHPNPIVRRMLGSKYGTLMRGATIVVAANPYIAEKAGEFGAPTIEILPTVVDLNKYEPLHDYSSERPAFGWIGTPVTAKYLEIVRPFFERAPGQRTRWFTAIGSGPLPWNNANVSVLPWTESGEVSDLRRLSVGIMPLVDSAFERGKSGLKLIQYMAAGLPIIASPVGVNVEIVEHGVNGFLASTPDEWEQAISALESDSSLRERMGRAGRKKVVAAYSLEGAAPKLASILITAAKGGKGGMTPNEVKV